MDEGIFSKTWAMTSDGKPAAKRQTPDGRLPSSDEVVVNSRRATALFGDAGERISIGRFTLLERIGSGGMGEVHAAYDEKLDRKVAIKLVRPAAGGCGGVHPDERLLREAQALARVSHPNVVQVYEAGMIAGRVFIAMEFLRGITLQQWLASEAPARGQKWRAVLGKLLDAGRGLAAAHHAGLVHRDFKPSNVLVGHDGRVCVIDFGLARVMTGSTTDESDSKSTQDTGPGPGTGPSSSDVLPRLGNDPGALSPRALTVAGAIMGTPAYMPPEQLNGNEADHRSDQFSFCVTVYEALYGRHPYYGKGKNLDKLHRSITTGKVAAPPGDSKVPVWIWRALVRGLAAAPDARYPSMGELLAALEREPGRRSRRLLAYAALVLGGVGAGSAAVLGMGSASESAASPCARAGEGLLTDAWSPAARAELAQAFAGTGLPYAEATTRSVIGHLDRYVASWRRERIEACQATHVERAQSLSLLELRIGCLDRHGQRLRGLIASFTHANASIVEHANEAVTGLPGLDACRDGATLRAGMEPPDAAAAVRVAAIRDRLAMSLAYEPAGRYDDGVRIADEQVRVAQAVGYPPVLAEALHSAGRLRLLRGGDGDIERGYELLMDAADMAEASRYDEEAADIWRSLAYIHQERTSDPSLIRLATRRALAAVERIGDQGLRRMSALCSKGKLLYRDGSYAEAERVQRQALALGEAQSGGGLPLAQCLQDLANTLDGLARTEEARSTYEQAINLLKSEVGRAHPSVSRLSFDYAIFLSQMGELDRARALLREFIARERPQRGADSLHVGRAELALANAEYEAGALAQALVHAERAYAIHLARLGADHHDMAGPLTVLGIIHLRSRLYAEAKQVTERALALQTTALGEDDVSVGVARSNLAEILIKLGRHGEALEQIAAAQQAFAAIAADHPVLRALPHKVRGLAFLGQGQARRAKEELEAALRLLREHPGYPLERADTAWALARAIRMSGAWPDERARALAGEAERIYASHGEAGERERAEIASFLAR